MGQMAKAGFIFNPAASAEDGSLSDNVVCLYCNLNLDSWEPGDQPTFVIFHWLDLTASRTKLYPL